MNTVRIADRTIYINGNVAGRIEGTRREVWVMGYPNALAERGQFVARFKYAQPGKKARAFIKAIFARVTMQEYLDLLPAAGSPVQVGRDLGVIPADGFEPTAKPKAPRLVREVVL